MSHSVSPDYETKLERNGVAVEEEYPPRVGDQAIVTNLRPQRAVAVAHAMAHAEARAERGRDCVLAGEGEIVVTDPRQPGARGDVGMRHSPLGGVVLNIAGKLECRERVAVRVGAHES